MSTSLTTNNQTTFSGEIRVASRIIDYLSSGLYPSPAACLKELINNSYDAGAKRVDVFVKPDADRIIIEDDGEGMNREEFERHFKRISESYKRDDKDITENGRPKIGKIGIGFIAANEICEVIEIYSTKADSTDLLHVSIDFQEMRKPIDQRRRGGEDFAKADYSGEVLTTEREAHFTQLFLTSVRGEAKEILAGATSQGSDIETRSLYGLKPETVEKLLSDPSLNTWKDFDAYSETLLQVALNVPIHYYADWMPAKVHDKVKEFEQKVTDLDFHVFYDGSSLGKPIVFAPPDDSILVSYFNFTGQSVSAKGYFYAQHGTIKPRDIQGLLVRIRHAAVGEYDSSFWGFSQSDSPLIQRWISAEVWADDRLEEAMNIDRRTLRAAHHAYRELREAIHKHLRTVLNAATTEIYKANRANRQQERTDVTLADVRHLAKEVIFPISPSVAKRLEAMANVASNRPRIRKALEKKYSLVELFNIVSETGNDILTKEQLATLFERIAARVGK